MHLHAVEASGRGLVPGLGEVCRIAWHPPQVIPLIDILTVIESVGILTVTTKFIIAMKRIRSIGWIRKGK